MPAAPRHGRVRWAEVTFANIASSDWPAVSRDHSGELWLAVDYNRQDAVSVAVPGSIASQRGFSSIHRENSEEKIKLLFLGLNWTETDFFKPIFFRPLGHNFSVFWFWVANKIGF